MELFDEEQLFKSVVGEEVPNTEIKNVRNSKIAKNYNESAFTKVIINKSDFEHTYGYNAKASLLLVRRNKYKELRQEIADTYPNCVVVFLQSATDGIFYGLKFELALKLVELLEDNFIIFPLHRAKNRNKYTLKGLARSVCEFNSRNSNARIVDIFMGGVRIEESDSTQYYTYAPFINMSNFMQQTVNTWSEFRRKLDYAFDIFECDVHNVIENSKHTEEI